MSSAEVFKESRNQRFVMSGCHLRFIYCQIYAERAMREESFQKSKGIGS
jgi:hypothetical protein